MIPARYANPPFSLLLSGMMSLLVSGITTFRAEGLRDGPLLFWTGNWLSSRIVAFPAVLVVRPVAWRSVARLCSAPSARPDAQDR